MSLVTVASVVSIAGGINGIVQSNKKQNNAGTPQDAAQAADPFGPLRSLYGQELGLQYGNLQRFDPNDVTGDPEYQFQLEQGMGAINKGAAASGMLGSGTRMMDLQKYGQGLASSFADRSYNRKASLLQMLGQFSGATTGSPSGAANALMQGQNNAYNQNRQGMGDIISGLGGLGRGINRPISGDSGYGGTLDQGGSMIWNNSGYGP